MARILVVEDDQRLRSLVARVLSEQGHDVSTTRSAMDGLQTVISEAPDLAVVDLGLPDLDGSELLKMIRAVSSMPVIIATARDDREEIVRHLDAGADDYLVKPFSAEELEARVRAVLRRTESGDRPGPLTTGGLIIDSAGRTATLEGVMLELSPKEFDLLRYLAEKVGEVVSKRELLAEVWREPYGGSEKTVDVHLSWLRKKLGESAAAPRYLHTVHGVGVKLQPPA